MYGQVLRQHCRSRCAGEHALAEPAGRVPPGVELGDLGMAAILALKLSPGRSVARYLQVDVHRSRAMNRCMTSLDPSKMRLMRESRIIRSTGMAGSPRSASDCSVS